LKDPQLSINSIATGTQASTVGYAPSTSGSFDQAAPASARSSVDGWGELEDGNIQEENGSDKEGWDDVDPFDDKPPPSLLSNIQAAQKRPVVQPKQAGKFAFVKCIGLFHAVARSTLIENTSKSDIIKYRCKDQMRNYLCQLLIALYPRLNFQLDDICTTRPCDDTELTGY